MISGFHCVFDSNSDGYKEVPIKENFSKGLEGFRDWIVLPSWLNLSRRGLPIPSILCPMCGIAVESTSHIFFGCAVSSDIFRKICSWWNVEEHYDGSDGYDYPQSAYRLEGDDDDGDYDYALAAAEGDGDDDDDGDYDYAPAA
ncbi:hypothetical protein Tco_1197977 [Tanacetum coccineum]